MRLCKTILSLALVVCSSALASEAKPSQPEASKFYQLGDGTSPIKILNSPGSSEVFMRDPNLGGSDIGNKSHVEKVNRSAVVKKAGAKKKASIIQRKPLRIAGSLRMPRVLFGRPVLDSKIRDESVDINFITRTLKEIP